MSRISVFSPREKNRTHVLSEGILKVSEVPCNGGALIDLGPIVFAKMKVTHSKKIINEVHEAPNILSFPRSSAEYLQVASGSRT
jgi:hypothetical protein